jgi:hypothetical protein
MTARPPADWLRSGTAIDCRRPDQVPLAPYTQAAGHADGQAAPGERSHRYLPGRCDYPAALLTRRLFGLEAARIVRTRPNAPRPCPQGRRRGHRPPS